MPQSCRARLSRHDFQFMAAVLNRLHPSTEDPFFQLAGDPESLNSLLDHPKLLDAVLSMARPVNISAEFYFYVLVRHALREAGINNVELADYVAATLAEFASGNPFRTAPSDQLQIDDVPYHVDFIEAINSATAYDRFYLHVRCGNQFLVLTGLFPEFIEHREERRGAPGVRYYEGVARESYRSAGEHPLPTSLRFAKSTTFSRPSSQSRRALNRMAREYMFFGN